MIELITRENLEKIGKKTKDVLNEVVDENYERFFDTLKDKLNDKVKKIIGEK